MIVMLQLIAGLVGFGIIAFMRNQQAKVKTEKQRVKLEG